MARDQTQRWRSYPPLALSVAAFSVVLLVLPSALDVPRTDPAPQLEFAPVPPSDEDPAPQSGGSIVGLGPAASGAGPAGSATPAGRPPGVAPPPPGLAATPRTKRCVGRPPRQTEDPASPPCVGYFDGDNGGGTHPGVEADEIRVVFYMESQDAGQLDEADENYDPGADNIVGGAIARYRRYFNDRFQTYGRNVRFFIHTSAVANAQSTPEQRTAEAVEALAAVDPFAVVNFTRNNRDAYVRVFTDAGRLAFLGKDNQANTLSQEEFRAAPGLMWAYWPAVEPLADLYTSVVCRQVVDRPAAFAGTASFNGEPRRLGLLIGEDPGQPALDVLHDRIRAGVEACGGVIEVDQRYPVAGIGCAIPPNAPAQAAQVIATFDTADVSTILFGGLPNPCLSIAARSINYLPEWVVLPDGDNSSNWFSRNYDQEAWQHARGVTFFPRLSDYFDQPCIWALEDSDPDGARDMTVHQPACRVYEDLRMLFTALQVSGPTLTPANVERGLRAIPAIPSGDPRLPACFYVPNDYTCVKDVQTQWWDPSGDDPQSNQPGCWRSMQEGKRDLVDTFEEREIESRRDDADPCNAQGVLPPA